MKKALFQVICGLSLIFAPAGYCFSEGLKGPFLWKAEKDGKSSYILGVFRFGVAWSDLQCSEEIAGFLEKAEVLLIESDPAMNQKAHQALQAQLAKNQNDITASLSGREIKSLSPASQKFLKDKLSQARVFGSGWPKLEEVSYFGLSVMLEYFCSFDSLDLQKFAERIGEFEGMAINFSSRVQQIAQSKNIAQQTLDDLEDLISLLKGPAYNYNVSAEDIESQIKAYDKNCSPKNIKRALDLTYQMFSRWTERYKAGELMRLESDLARLRDKDFPDHIERMLRGRFVQTALKARKEKWPEKIAFAHKRYNSAFVSADISPLTGANNVIGKLKKKGFAFKRMGPACRF